MKSCTADLCPGQGGLPHLLHLSENGATLALNGLLVQLSVLNDVTQDLHSLGNIVLQHLGIEGGDLAAGVGVQVAAHVFNVKLQLMDLARLP